ncbi:sugar transferase [bacterium]|nr:sugar transferase [bacterium]
MRIKRFFDFIVSGLALLLVGPFLVIVMFAIYLQDRHSPIYKATRAGKNGKPFVMYKIRSMVVNAETLGGSSTGNADPRITAIGRFVRKYKLDELSQLWNVFTGDMSLVGPRPNTVNDIKFYTQEENELLSIVPGITDFSSIVFADEGAILENKQNPDLAYNQLIRPWKSRLGIFYCKNRSFILDLKLIFLTLVTIVNRSMALSLVQRILLDLGAPDDLVRIASRKESLMPFPPPGMEQIVKAGFGMPL